ncbi:cilia- and flagella-associated protein 157 [Schistocerca cancellata]|uniref:cilia- and flagella-associated protein 157 n=1 Tax=Schistocerca cancellata TaxID=274614 RepID=UPI0021183C76|nr:cilia- and flagella-associated protein 157 [Schistocerca cancellata]
MGKKGKGGKKGNKKKEKEEVVEELSEVDKELYQLQITDLTRKVERLKARCLDLELSNEEYQKLYEVLDEDRADIISYLKKILQEKVGEIQELQERIDGLKKSREAETKVYKNKISQMEHDYKMMHEQLTSEILLINGKLNSLEEFRIQRDELMNKFSLQEKEIAEQEKRHKQTLYEVERQFILAKDKAMKEMETRLLQLSNDFEDATQTRIAATTQRAIRENIALNNELDKMLETNKYLKIENEMLKEKNMDLKTKMKLYEAEKHQALTMCVEQQTRIETLTSQQQRMEQEREKLQAEANTAATLQQELNELEEEVNERNNQLKATQQELQKALRKQSELNNKIAEAQMWSDKLENVLQSAVTAIKEALMVQQDLPDDSFHVSKREALLKYLLELINISEADQRRRVEKIDRATSAVTIYGTGDLGLVPAPMSIRSSHALKPKNNMTPTATIEITGDENVKLRPKTAGPRYGVTKVHGLKPQFQSQYMEEDK